MKINYVQYGMIDKKHEMQISLFGVWGVCSTVYYNISVV